MNHEHWLELADIHALGALDGKDLLALQNHLQSDCALCREHLQNTESLLSALPAAIPVILPPAQLKEVLMSKIDAAPALPAVGKKSYVPAVAAVAVMFAAAVIWVGAPYLRPSSGSAPSAAGQPIHDAGMIQILKNPDVRLIEFKDPATGAKILAKLYWSSKACGGCLTVKGLSKTEAGKVYEFWGITGDKPVAAGTFTADENGNAHLDVHSMGAIKNFDKFAVTIEPAGGVPLPTGPMKLLSL